MATYERIDESIIEEILETGRYQEPNGTLWILSEQTPWADDGEYLDSCWVIFRNMTTGFHYCAWVTRDHEGGMTYPDYCVMVRRVEGIGINWVPVSIAAYHGGNAERV